MSYCSDIVNLFPPRERGLEGEDLVGASEPDVSPARAGIRGKNLHVQQGVTSFPRASGD